MENNRVKEDMICPETGKHCEDECCTVGSECNLSGDEIEDIKEDKQEQGEERRFTIDDMEDCWDACEKYIQNEFKHYSDQKNLPDKKQYLTSLFKNEIGNKKHKP